jgi:hypothetical protein
MLEKFDTDCSAFAEQISILEKEIINNLIDYKAWEDKRKKIWNDWFRLAQEWIFWSMDSNNGPRYIRRKITCPQKGIWELGTCQILDWTKAIFSKKNNVELLNLINLFNSYSFCSFYVNDLQYLLLHRTKFWFE